MKAYQYQTPAQQQTRRRLLYSALVTLSVFMLMGMFAWREQRDRTERATASYNAYVSMLEREEAVRRYAKSLMEPDTNLSHETTQPNERPLILKKPYPTKIEFRDSIDRILENHTSSQDANGNLIWLTISEAMPFSLNQYQSKPRKPKPEITLIEASFDSKDGRLSLLVVCDPTNSLTVGRIFSDYVRRFVY
jgi:hypothetical protein